MTRISFYRPLALFLALSYGAACMPHQQEADAGDKEGAPFAFRIDRATGKADGEGVLSSADLARVTASFEQAIQNGEAEITRLTGQIQKLDADNQRKQSEISTIISAIESEKQNAERLRNAGIAGAVVLGLLTFGLGSVIAGAGAAGSAVLAAKSDDKVRQMTADLNRARDEQRAIQTQIAQYQAQKTTITAQLASIRESKVRLVAALQSPAPVGNVAVNLDAQTLGAFQRARLLEQILGHTQSEIDALTTLRNAAQALSDALDKTLEVLRALAADAEKLGKQAREDFLSILETVLSGDPTVVATAWLVDELADKTKEMLTALKFPAADFVSHLVRTRFTGTDADVRALIESLLAKLGTIVFNAATAWDETETMSRAVALPDQATVSSTLNVTNGGTLAHGRLTVDISHTYVGDLRLVVRHAGKSQTLRVRSGGAGARIAEGYDLTTFVGASAGGTWELIVSDEAARDAGTLTSWKLELSGTL